MATVALLVTMTRRGPARARLLAALAAQGMEARAWTPRPPWEPPDPAPAADVAVLRMPSGAPDWAMDEAARVAAPARLVVDALDVLRGVHDKAALMTRLHGAGVRTPPTVLVARDRPADLSRLPDGALVLKPARGAGGRGVLLRRTRAQAERGARAFADASGPVLVQGFVEGRERRLLVVGDEVVAAMERVPAGADGRASLHYGAVPVAIVPAEADVVLALRVARLVGLQIAAVDVVGDDVVLEVNACPGLAGIEQATGRDVAAAIAAWVARRARAFGV